MREAGLRLAVAALTTLEESPPMTLRQLYYRLVSKAVIPNTHASYQRLARVTVQARVAEYIPWKYIIDRTREVQKVSSWSDLPDFLDTVRASYRKDLWQDNPERVEIWLEKDALSGIFRGVLDEYQAPLVVTRGYPSRSLLYESVELIEEDGRPCSIYYFGDHDPSGRDIERVCKDAFRESDTSIEFERVAILPSDIGRFGLPPMPAKTSDTRHRRFVAEFGDACVELDALPPNELRNRLRAVVRRHIDADSWDRLRNIEAQERATLMATLQRLGAGR